MSNRCSLTDPDLKPVFPPGMNSRTCYRKNCNHHKIYFLKYFFLIAIPLVWVSMPIESMEMIR